jgi:Leucine-rich repeat (LRR) protein
MLLVQLVSAATIPVDRDLAALTDIFAANNLPAPIRRNGCFDAKHAEIECVNGRVTLLVMASMGLTRMPESIGQLDELIEIDVHANDLTQLPDSLGKLSKLELLRVYSNKLTSLPDSIFSLPSLWNLDVHVNRLTSLPPVTNLINLEHLDVSDNKFEALSESIADLPNLYSL